MRRKLIGISIAAMLVGISAFAQGTAAAGPAATSTATPAAPTVAGPNKVGVINIQAVVVSTNEGKREFDALNKKFEPKQTELQNLQKKIQAAQSQMQTQGEKMNEDARATLQKQIDADQKTLQRNADDAQTDFQAQQNEVFGRMVQKVGPIVVKFAQENGYAVLLDDSNPWPQGQVLWALDTVNVTQSVIDAYNTSSGVPTAPGATRPTTPTGPRPTGSTGTPGAIRPSTPAGPRPTTPTTGGKPPQK